MKLTNLLENYSTADRDLYTIHLHSDKITMDTLSRQSFVADVDVDIKQYETFYRNPGEVMKRILEDVYSLIITKYEVVGLGNIGIPNLKLTDRLNGGGSTILIGKRDTLFNVSRMFVIDIENPEEDIENIVSYMGELNLPTPQECMTQLERAHTISSMATRKYDVKDINVELTLLPKMKSVVNVILNSTPENEDEESIGFKLASALKPYNIRPQINGGSIIGTT